MSDREVVVLSAARSAIGTYSGTLAGFEPADLGGLIIKEAVARSGADPEQISYLTLGNCIPTESRSPYVARVAAIQGGLPHSSTAVTVNRLCGSGMQSIVSTAQSILLGDADFGVGAGSEVMSKGGYLSPAMRFGARMGDTKLVDMMVSTLTDPFGVGHMGITAENLAEKWNISREEQDQFAAESQRRAQAAIEGGYFKDQIVPVTIKSRKGEKVFDTDEHPRFGVTVDDLAKMRPAFKKEGGTVTAGNASGINDAAAALVLADRAAAEKAGYKPMARLVAYGIAGVPNDVMGEGPIPSSKVALDKAGLSLGDMDVVESNEAFAAQALTVMKGLGLDPEKTNPNGGAIALGHPVGATGTILAVKALHELQRVQGKYALVTMCIGGGQGITAIFERM
ncbi:acetyl-CoA C-acetyltransferase [Alkalispirillum mobile]|uniref:Acetyl-CoA C-acetyltransferase n=1 Tax=Alkalispirillum mobile TaxID=85925 RepID=A0A498C6P3_9GAMM|nr:acetyl-CoA C-acyltransferase family protein [Alkalispirillum mobile]RLK51033.1 acetyl-CoA C-acetyltransferase [Alkalispirillum mobile]